VRVHLDGRVEPELSGELAHTVPDGLVRCFLGGRSDGLFGFEGRLDEVALYGRALSPEEIASRYAVSGLTPPVAAAPVVESSVVPPQSPEESRRGIRVREGFEVELVAAEPLTCDPVAIDWDASGRLWVVEMADYPLGMDGAGRAGGRVRVLEDVDGDGRFDSSVLFAEGLNFPTGLLTWRDGVIVTVAPEVVFLRDTDGDGVADEREVLVTGLLEGNQQLRGNGLRWGLDNWVYCAAGGHHGEYGVGNALLGVRRGLRVEVGSRDFRFRPDTGELEAASGPSQFGRERDDWGRWFGTQNSRPLWHYVLADHYLRRNPHVAAPDPTRQVVVPLNPKVWPASAPEKRFHSFENGGHFTSACSGMIYRDTLFFPAGPGHAFTCEPFHNLVQHNVLNDDGVSFAASRDPVEEGVDFFASEDRWCRPVMVRTGPDGALWVVDMYRYMIEHPDWLPAEGRAELLPHYRLGEDRGRIYRVFPRGVAPRPPVRLDREGPQGWVAALESANGWVRDKAHQLLLWDGQPGAGPALRQLAMASENPQARVQALSVLDGLGLLEPEAVVRALADQHPGVRENALRLAEARGTPEVVAAAADLADDVDPKVRLQAALTLGEWESPVAGEALGRLAVSGSTEPFVRAAVLSSALPHARAVAAAVVAEGDAALSLWSGSLIDLGLAVNDRAVLATLLAPAVASVESGGRLATGSLEVLSGFLSAVARRGSTLDDWLEPDDALTGCLRSLGLVVEAGWRVLRDAGMPVADRSVSSLFLVQLPSERERVFEVVSGWLLSSEESGELQEAAVAVLVATGGEAVPGVLVRAWPSASPRLREVLLGAVLTREQWAVVFLGGLPDGVPLLLDAAGRDRLLRHGSAEVRAMAEKRLAPAPGRSEVLARFRAALELTGDQARGQAVYARLCVHCHREGGVGQEVGPNLESVAAHAPDKLLTNILAPNVDVQPGYHAYQARLRDGTDVYGLVVAETGNSLTFKSADGAKRTVLRGELTSLQSTGLSLMPEGLEAGLSEQDMADLIRYLRRVR